jgi:hypothetical protein
MEYMAAMVRAEIDWLRSVIADLRARRLTWSEAWLRRIAAQFLPPEESAVKPTKSGTKRGSGRKARKTR